MKSSRNPGGEPGLAGALRRARARLEPLASRLRAAALALDLLDRDLLPRSAGGDDYLVAGIVGPNNSGKSALFNAMVGRDLSPSSPAGGATRRLVGAAHPTLLSRLRAEPTLSRFRMRAISDAAAAANDILTSAEQPSELLVFADDRLPEGLMLIDTPDFDSILADNRLASESLLNVADLVVVVVTRHSYQNREVVQFLVRWLDHARPWMLVYNEAIDEAVARAHADKLAADVGTPPLASFWAPHSLAVQRGAEPLAPEPLPLDGEPAAVPAIGLRELLLDARRVSEVKARAFSASLARLRAEMAAAAEALAAQAAQARDLLAAAEQCAGDAGARIATASLPGEPFVAAFRDVLDRRSNPLSRSWRRALRQLRLRLESLPSLWGGRGAAPGDAAREGTSALERQELGKVWPRFWEELARDLGPEARHPARQEARSEIVAALNADLADQRRVEARRHAEEALGAAPGDIGAFRRECEQLIERAIEERGFDLDIQAAADVATMLPLALAAAVIVNTGGIGSDLAAAGGGALSTFLVEKYAHLLGSGIMAQARRRWTRLRAGQLARVLIDAALERTAPLLRASLDDDAAAAAELRELAEAAR